MDAGKMIDSLLKIMRKEDFEDLMANGSDEIADTMIITEGGFVLTLNDVMGSHYTNESDGLKALIEEQIRDGLTINDMAYVFLCGKRVNVDLIVSFSDAD